MNTELQNQENDVQRKVLEEILVEEMSGFVAYYDPETKEVEQADSLTVDSLQEEKQIIVFPGSEVLYPYGEAMHDYLISEGIDVPEGRYAKSYVYEQQGGLYGFYDFRREERLRRMNIWLKEHKLNLYAV